MAKRRQRKNRRRRGGKRRRRLTNAIPRLSISANSRTLRIGYAYDVYDNSKRRDITFGDIFKYPPNTGIPFQFREGRVNRATVFWQSDNATADAGSVCLNVEDYGENSGTDSAVFHELLSYPGSMVRKVWQNVSNVWYPTEPSDRDFHSLTSGDGIMTITVRHSIKDAKLKGRIVIFSDVTCRGKSVDRSQLALTLLDQYEVVDARDLPVRMDGVSLSLSAPLG